LDPRISMITLGVSDLERSTRFYRDGLGLPMYDWQGGGISFFTTGTTWLALYPLEALADDAGVNTAREGFPGVTLAHNVGFKAAVDAVLKEAVSAGAIITKPAEDKEWGGYSGYFSDPDGYLWEVAWNPHFDLT